MNRRVGIVGGGLSGVYAAWLLEKAGQGYVLLESRERFGGRLLTVRAESGNDDLESAAFDLGATWYWPDMQPQLAALVDELGLHAFAQHSTGELVFESGPGQTRRFPGFDSSPASMRLAGGMASLVQALRSRLEPDRLFAGHRVTALEARGHGVVIAAQDTKGRSASFDVGHVLLAVPPRLAQATIRFETPLPGEVSSDWAAAATWMAPHAKYLAVYPEPFWRRRGLSGSARSHTGPMVEVHDASGQRGLGALFGFVGVPAVSRAGIPEASMRQLCRAQFGRLFGAEAAQPLQDWLQDWSREPCTATPADLHADGQHGHGAAQVLDGVWAGRLTGVASEWSKEFPGYVAGAVDAARRGVALALRPVGASGRSAGIPLA